MPTHIHKARLCVQNVLHPLIETFCRKLEDKLRAVHIELPDFVLNLNTDELRKNRDMPSAFLCHLGVLDVSLPLKGTAHRRVRGSPESEMAVKHRFFDLFFKNKENIFHCNQVLRKHVVVKAVPSKQPVPNSTVHVLVHVCFY